MSNLKEFVESASVLADSDFDINLSLVTKEDGTTWIQVSNSDQDTAFAIQVELVSVVVNGEDPADFLRVLWAAEEERLPSLVRSTQDLVAIVVNP